MGKLKFVKLQAATLIETIVSLVIILVIFGIVTGFLVQLSLSSFSIREIKAIQLLNNYAAETNEQKAFFDEELTAGDMYIKREIIPDNRNNNLINVKFGIYDRDHRLITLQQRLVYLK